MNLTFRALTLGHQIKSDIYVKIRSKCSFQESCKSADLSAKVHCSILKSLLDTRKERFVFSLPIFIL